MSDDGAAADEPPPAQPAARCFATAARAHRIAATIALTRTAIDFQMIEASDPWPKQAEPSSLQRISPLVHAQLTAIRLSLVASIIGRTRARCSLTMHLLGLCHNCIRSSAISRRQQLSRPSLPLPAQPSDRPPAPLVH